MRLYEFKLNSLSRWKPKSIVKNGKTHHNLRVGDYRKGCWEYMIGVEDTIVDLTQPPLPLYKEYTLEPLYVRNASRDPLKDKERNAMYYVREIDAKESDASCILALTLTSNYILDVKVVDDNGIQRLATYRQKFTGVKEMHVYRMHSKDVLVFTVDYKHSSVLYKVCVKNGMLNLTVVSESK